MTRMCILISSLIASLIYHTTQLNAFDKILIELRGFEGSLVFAGNITITAVVVYLVAMIIYTTARSIVIKPKVS